MSMMREVRGIIYTNVLSDLTGGADLWECNECGAIVRIVKAEDHSDFHIGLEEGE